MIARITQSAITGEAEAVWYEGKSLFRFDYEGLGEAVSWFDGEVWWQLNINSNKPQRLEGTELAWARSFVMLTPHFLSWQEFDGSIKLVTVAGTITERR